MFGSGRKKDPGAPAAGDRRAGPPLLAARGRFNLFAACVLIAFVAVFARLWWLHVYTAPKLRAEAEAARRYKLVLKAERGRILDSKGGVLALSREVWEIGVDPNEPNLHKEDIGEVSSRLAKILGIPTGDVLAAFSRKYRTVSSASSQSAPTAGGTADAPGLESAPVVADDAGAEQRLVKWVKLAEGVDLKTREAVAALRVKAVIANRYFVREYPRGELAAHLVGYMNKEGVPAMGVEKALDFFLTGEDGWIDSQRNARGKEMAERRVREIQPCDGYNVELTLDALIQQAVEEELRRIDEEFSPKSAIAIVSEANSGRILALANRPTFNLNEYNNKEKAPLESQRNRAVTDVYEPGSVFKVVFFAIGLQEGLFTPDTPLDCGDRSPMLAPYKGRLLKLPKDDHPIGRSDLRHAVWKSSNRGAALVGMRVAEARGEERLWQYMADFGFGSETGLVTGTEVKGVLHRPEKWDGLTISRLPAGHAVSVTALQMHAGMSVIAAKGDLYAPMLVNRIVGRDGRSLWEFAPMLRKKGVISRATAETMCGLLKGVVSKDGTAVRAEIPGYEVAGKTGTTQKIVNGQYSSAHHVASFSGFFPASHPRIVITVVLDEPRGKGIAYGGVYSAPAFRNIAEKVINYLEIPPANPAEAAAAQEKERKKRGLAAPAPPPARGALLLDPL